MVGKPVLIKNGHVIVNADKVIVGGCVYIKDGTIAYVGKGVLDSTSCRSNNKSLVFERSVAKSRSTNLTVIDAGGRVVLPGFINCHMHLYSQFAKGISVPRMSSFGEILEKLWWKLDRALTEEDVYYSALLGLIDSIRSGVTTVFDHHASYGFIRGSLGTIARAFLKTGVRGSLCFEVSDRAGDKKRDESIRENAAFLEKCQRHLKTDRTYPLRGMVGLHASMTLSDHTLAESRREMDNYNVGAHVHVAEAVEDVRAVKRLYNEGILREGTIAAHCVHVNGSDLDILKKSGTFVVHNPQSNLNNAVGVAPFLKMNKKRIPVGIGTDGMSASIVGDVKLASVLHKIVARDPAVGFVETKRSAMETNSAIASEMFGFNIGSLKKGSAADVIISDYIPQTPLTNANIWGHMLFGVMNLPVRTTICGGKILMKDFEIKAVDEENIIVEAKKCAKRLWNRF
jgi:putative selenium metabolism protein SsnA